MANVRQDRVVDPTLERASVPAPSGPAVNGRGGAARTIVLALRLRRQDSGGSPGEVSRGVESPAAALATDVISASGGALDPPQGAVLAAKFFDLSSALLAARRLQWALEGLAESAGSQGAAASMVVQSTQDPAASAVISLDHVAPGQILISSRVADALQQFPGATVKPTADRDWRELQWRRLETPSNYSADEQSVLGLIRALGREDPSPHQAEAVRPSAVPEVAPPIDVPRGLGRSVLEPEPEPSSGKRKWLILGGAAAVVGLGAALVIIGFGGHGTPPPQNPGAATNPVAPPASPTPQAAPPTPPPVVQKPETPKPQAKAPKQPKPEPKVEQPVTPKIEAGTPKVPAGPCTFTDAEIPRSLSRAENYMYAGKLDEAEAMYQRVLGCPSGHEKALQGLQRVHQRMAAQSP